MTAETGVKYGDSVTLDNNAFAKTNMYFMGWATDEKSTIPLYSNGATVMNLTDQENITLYAVWSSNQQYYVTYNANGGTGGPQNSSTPYDVDDTVTPDMTNAPTRAGYDFVGWATSATATEKVDSAEMVAGGLTFYAVWEQKQTYTVTYDANTGTGSVPMDPNRYESGDTAAVISNPQPTKTGYTFKGWATTADGTDTVTQVTVNNNVTLYAIWTANTYTVTFEDRGTGMNATQDFTYDEPQDLNQVGTREGYQFLGWAASEANQGLGIIAYAGGANVLNLTPVANGEVTLYGVWEQYETIITLNADGGQGGSTVFTVKYGDLLPDSLVAPTRYGYMFQGYFAGEVQYFDGNMKPTKTDPWNSTEATLELTAKWEGISYTVEYYNEGQPISGSQQPATYGTAFTLKKVAELGPTTPTGKRFGGWSPYPGSTAIAYADGQEIVDGLTAEPGSTVRLYAVWVDKEKYTVAYNANGGAGGPTDGNAYLTGAEVNVQFTAPIRQGHTFLGWATSSNAIVPTYEEGKTEKFNMGSSNVVLYAVWRANQYTVTYNANGGDGTILGTTMTYGESGSLSDGKGLTRTGYTFAGWATEVNGGVTYLPGMAVYNLSAADGDTIELFAVWTAKKVTVTFDPKDGTVSPNRYEYTYDSPYGMLPTPTKTGYTFTGWY